MWILLHNNDDQGIQAQRRATNAGLNFINVSIPGKSADASQSMIAAHNQIQQQNNNLDGVIYSGHGNNNGKSFMTSDGKTVFNTQNFSNLLGLASPTRVVLLSCFGGTIVENNLDIFRSVNNSIVQVAGVGYQSNLIGCHIEGPKTKIIGAQIEAMMTSLATNALNPQFTSARGDFDIIL